MRIARLIKISVGHDNRLAVRRLAAHSPSTTHKRLLCLREDLKAATKVMLSVPNASVKKTLTLKCLRAGFKRLAGYKTYQIS